MSEVDEGVSKTSATDAVSAVEEDSLEYQFAVVSSAADVVMSAASNSSSHGPMFPSQSPYLSSNPILNGNQMSLQELIEAELNSRLAPLQPDSLDGATIGHEYHHHQPMSGDITNSCTTLLDSLEAPLFSLDSLVDVESGVDLTSPNPPFGGSPPSSHSSLIHDSSFNQINENILVNFQSSNHFDDNLIQEPLEQPSVAYAQPPLQTASDFQEDNNVNLDSLELDLGSEAKTEELILDLKDTSEVKDVNEATNFDVENVVESDNIILIEEESLENSEQVVVENISFGIKTINETIIESHCSQGNMTTTKTSTSEENVYDGINDLIVKEKTSVSQFEEKRTITSQISIDSQKDEKIKDIDSSSFDSNILSEVSNTFQTATESHKRTYELNDLSVSKTHKSDVVNVLATKDHVDVAQPQKMTIMDSFSHSDKFIDFTINHFDKPEPIDCNINHFKQSNSVDNKINHFYQSEPVDDKTYNINLSAVDNNTNHLNQSESTNNSKSHHFNHSESTDDKTNHKLIKNIIDVSNSYNFIDVINNKELAVLNNSLLPADVTNGDDEELWPEDGDKKEEIDEFQKMEQEVEREMEEEKKKKRSDTDKRGKKKKKRKGESEKENKELSPYLINNNYSSADEVDGDDATDPEEVSFCNGHSSPEGDKKSECRLASFVEEDDLSNISVKQLTASYLSAAEQSPRKRSPSPNSTPIRPRTPISRLVGTYSNSTSPVASMPPSAIQASTPNGTTSSIYPSDFTPGVTLKSLKSAYEASARKAPSPNTCSSPAKDEVHVTFSQLREAYCNVASNSPLEGNSPTPRATTPLRSQNDKALTATFRSMETTQVSSDCHICGKQVFQMEKIVAEKASWHKNCFRCSECNKNLTLETYQSHEGSLYCKPHFKELFRPKAVVQDEAEERKDRSTATPDYGLEELQSSLNVKQRFAQFENFSKAVDEPKLESVSVRRSQSLMSKAAKFSNGHENGEFDDTEEEELGMGEDEEEESEEGEGEEGDDPNYVKSRKKKERPMSFSGMGDLKAVWEQKQRREEMSQSRKEDLSKFRQMLCAGKNITLKEMFESGNFEGADENDNTCREEIKIEERRAAHNLKARFEKGQPFIMEDEEGGEEGSRHSAFKGEKQEVEETFRDAETAKQARNVFKHIDKKVIQEGSVILRSPSFATQNRDNRRSLDISLMMPQRSTSTAEVVKSSEPLEENLEVDTTDLATRFKFFATFEERQKEENQKKRKVFRITPPREGADQGVSQGSADSEILGRDPNLIKCTDNYQDDVDCRNTKNILQMFKKMEMGEEDEEEEEEGPRPLKCFTPPPEDGEGDDSEEYSDEEYSEGDEEETDEDEEGKPKYKDELLEMGTCPQSVKKAANLRAKFEKWETEVERQNELNRDKDSELEEECRPSLDTTRNLKAMFEHKAIEVTKPVTSKPVTQKINRFVGATEKCVSCGKSVYAMEKLEIHGRILHKNCFKCHKCSSRLSVGSFSFGGEHMFCTTHYKQLFTEKGSYDAFLSGKDKWTSKIEATNADDVKSQD